MNAPEPITLETELRVSLAAAMKMIYFLMEEEDVPAEWQEFIARELSRPNAPVGGRDGTAWIDRTIAKCVLLAPPQTAPPKPTLLGPTGRVLDLPRDPNQS